MRARRFLVTWAGHAGLEPSSTGTGVLPALGSPQHRRLAPHSTVSNTNTAVPLNAGVSSVTAMTESTPKPSHGRADVAQQEVHGDRLPVRRTGVGHRYDLGRTLQALSLTDPARAKQRS